MNILKFLKCTRTLSHLAEKFVRKDGKNQKNMSVKNIVDNKVLRK